MSARIQHGSLFYWHIYENLSLPDNTMENVEAIYTTLACICIETFGDDILVDLVRIAFGIQVSAYFQNFHASKRIFPKPPRIFTIGVLKAILNRMILIHNDFFKTSIVRPKRILP